MLAAESEAEIETWLKVLLAAREEGLRHAAMASNFDCQVGNEDKGGGEEEEEEEEEEQEEQDEQDEAGGGGSESVEKCKNIHWPTGGACTSEDKRSLMESVDTGSLMQHVTADMRKAMHATLKTGLECELFLYWFECLLSLTMHQNPKPYTLN